MTNKKINCQMFKTGYIDESGDSGKLGSKCLDERKKISKIMKKTREQLNRLGGEIKFFGFPDKKILLKTIEEFAKLKFQIRFITIYKDNKNIDSSEKMRIIFDLLGETFNLCEMPHKIIADKDYFKNKKIAYLAVKDYEETIYEGGVKGQTYKIYVMEEERINKEDFNLTVSIKHENSKENLGLQVADLISGAIFQEMEYGNKDYTDSIRKFNELKGRVIKPKE